MVALSVRDTRGSREIAAIRPARWSLPRVVSLGLMVMSLPAVWRLPLVSRSFQTGVCHICRMGLDED